MKLVTPKVFVIGESTQIKEGMEAMLDHLGVPDWHTDAVSDAEMLSEVAGKLCYMSFDTDLNKNLTRTGMRNNEQYLQEGIIATKHGSVLEHTVVNFVLLDVSRVLTHELVRHGDGTAFSQESGRYVRRELGMFIPSIISEQPALLEAFIEAIRPHGIRELARTGRIALVRNSHVPRPDDVDEVEDASAVVGHSSL